MTATVQRFVLTEDLVYDFAYIQESSNFVVQYKPSLVRALRNTPCSEYGGTLPFLRNNEFELSSRMLAVSFCRNLLVSTNHMNTPIKQRICT